LKACPNDRDAGLGRGHRPVDGRAGGFISRALDRNEGRFERACVKMSHKSAGLTIDENGTTCKVTLQIKNPLICKWTLGFGLAGAIVALQCDMNECM